MNSRVLVSLIVAALLTTSGILLFNRFSSLLSFNANTVSGQTNTVTIDGKTFVVEVARTTAEQSAGLSNRKVLAAGAGMLFPFSPAAQPYFWMRDMKFPLDLVWINNGKIVTITRHAPIPKTGQDNSTLPMYQATAAIDNVLEINSGQADSFKVGDSVTINTQSSI